VIWAIKAAGPPLREIFVSVAVHKSTRSARKPKGEGYVRRAEILEAGERIFVEYGYEGATIRRIAEEVGVSSTALYMHFKDKSEILLEICERVFDRMLNDQKELAKGCPTPEERVRVLLQSYITFGLANPNAYRLVFCTRPREATEGAEKVAQRLGKELFDGFAGHVAEIAAAGRLRGDPISAAQALWAGAHGLISLEITKPYFDWAPTLDTTMLDALFEGVLAR
jgi:AcrR family transcriptional regulator